MHNISDDRVILFYKNHSSPWFQILSEAEEWLSKQEEEQLHFDNDDDIVVSGTSEWEVVGMTMAPPF